MNTQAVHTERRTHVKCRKQIKMRQQALGVCMSQFERQRKTQELAEFILSVRRG